MNYRPGEPDRGLRAGADSSTTISIIIVVLVIGLIAIAAFLFWRGGSDDDSAVAESETPTATLPVLVEGTAPESATGELVDVEPTPSPSPSLTMSPTDAPEVTPSPTPEEPDEEPTAPEEPTATEEVGETDPTATEDDGGSDVEPPIGDYGQLPPAQLPSGGAALSLNLDYQLALSLESLPSTGTVFWIEWPTYSLADVQQAAVNLGLDGEVVEEGVGIYRVNSDTGSLFVSSSEIVFHAAGSGEGGEPPDDATAIAAAREWLLASGLIGGDMDSGAVIGRDDASGRVVVQVRPVEPQPNLAPQPSATATVGPGAAVSEVRIRWPGSLVPSEYGLMDPIDIWSQVESGRGYLEADLSSVFGSGPFTGTATLTDYSVAYTMAGSPAGDEYLVPIITFHGYAILDQTGDEIAVSVSVPAVYHQVGSLG